MRGFSDLFRRRIRLGFLVNRRLLATVAIIAMMFLSCVYGAASIFYNLAPASYLRSAFLGFDAWLEHGNPRSITSKAGLTQLGVSFDAPGKTFDGFTLYTTTQGTSASLIDMSGNVVHKWSVPFRTVWPHPNHVKHPVPDDQVHWFRCRLFPNGDLLAVYQSDTDSPHGYGLAKLNKDSRPLWTYSDSVHHDFDIGDDGKIYALTDEISNERIKGLDSIAPPYLLDSLVILTPEGQRLEKISILEAFHHSPFALMLASAGMMDNLMPIRPPSMSPPAPGNIPAPVDPSKTIIVKGLQHVIPQQKERGDVLHANAVKVLNRAMAPKFPMFKEGQVLLSVRGLDAIAILDIPSRSIVWAAQGIWRGQHDPEFLENGHLLLYDNSGLGQSSRVIEYDPVRNGYPWSYAYEDSNVFVAGKRGMKQHLPNGNVLIVDPDGGRLFEVTPAKSLVWEFGCPAEGFEENSDRKPHAIVTGALRYSPKDLKFLEGTPVRR